MRFYFRKWRIWLAVSGTFILLLVSASFALAAGFSPEWVRTWGGAGTQGAGPVVTDAQGNSYVIDAPGQIYKYSPSGGQLWRATSPIGGGVLSIDPSGNFIYVAGHSGTAMAATQIDAQTGAIGNTYYYHMAVPPPACASSTERGLAVAVDASGNVYLGGTSTLFDSTGAPCNSPSQLGQLAKFQAGVVSPPQWIAPTSYNPPYESGVTLNPAGNTVYTVGGVFYIYLQKFSPSSNVPVWTADFSPTSAVFPGTSYAFSLYWNTPIRADSSGNLFVAAPIGLPYQAVFSSAMKFHDNGGSVSLSWGNILDSQTTTYQLAAGSSAISPAGHFYLPGTRTTYSGGYSTSTPTGVDVFVAEFDPSSNAVSNSAPNLVSLTTYDGGSNDYGGGVAFTSSTDFFLSGKTYVNSTVGYEYLLVRYGTQTTCTSPLSSFSAWTNPTLTAGATAISSTHINELRSKVNQLQTDAGLPVSAWTDGATLASGAAIKAQYITELRTALAAIYTACGQTAPVWTYPTVSAGSVIHAADIADLRNAVINAK